MTFVGRALGKLENLDSISESHSNDGKMTAPFYDFPDVGFDYDIIPIPLLNESQRETKWLHLSTSSSTSSWVVIHVFLDFVLVFIDIVDVVVA